MPGTGGINRLELAARTVVPTTYAALLVRQPIVPTDKLWPSIGWRRSHLDLATGLCYPRSGRCWASVDYCKGARMAVETPTQLFEEHVPNRLKEKPEVGQKINSTYKFVVSGDAGGTWFVDLTVPGGAITTEDKEAKCTVTITDENLVAIVNGKLNPQMAFMSGKLKVAGDMGLALKLTALFG